MLQFIKFIRYFRFYRGIELLIGFHKNDFFLNAHFLTQLFNQVTNLCDCFLCGSNSIGYNLLSDRIRRLTVEMDNFAQELLSDLETHYEGTGGG